MSIGSQSITRTIVSLALCALAVVGCATRNPDDVVVAALQPAAPPEAGPAYRIQPGDELHVRFTYQPELSDQVPVRPDGRISLGPTGEIIAAGLKIGRAHV